MKYMFLTYLNEQEWLALSEAEQQEQMDRCRPHVETMVAAGKILDGAPLHPTSTATTISVKHGKRLVTDGPFAETREQLGGYTIIDADNLDEAIEIAAGFLGDHAMSTVEIRPIVEYAMPARR